jgi:hypothetical protein
MFYYDKQDTDLADITIVIILEIHPTLVQSKNVENKNECVGEDL